MRPVSSRFLASLRGSHRRTYRATVVASGQTGTSPTGTELSVINGDAKLDFSAAIRSILDLTVDGTGLFPDNADDLLAPYGNEIFVEEGLVFGDGDIEYVSLGYFRILECSQDDAPDGPIQINAQDRMAGILEARLLNPIQFTAARTYGSVVNELVQEVYPWATIQWDDYTYSDVLGRSVIAEEDRYGFLNELVTALGKIWYWDHRGILVIRDVPAQDEPVWETNFGENGVMINLGRELSRDGVYNAVKASGEALDNVSPVYAVAYDNNPDSPTYYYGDFGKVHTFFVSPFLTTVGQAQSAADGLLKKKLGLPYQVEFTAISNPALEPGDAVLVNLAGEPPKPVQTLVNDGFNRTVVDGWGTADSGKAWSVAAPATWDVSGGIGTIANPDSNSFYFAALLTAKAPDVDGYFLASAPNVATGSTLVVGATTRYTNANNNYHMRLEFRTDGLVGCKMSKYVGGAYSEIAANNPVPGLTYSAGQIWRVRFRNVGNQLKMKVWVDGESEPANWTLETTDTSHSGGAVGMMNWKLPSNTNVGVQWNIHEFVAKTYPGFPSGSEVHVIETLNIPLDPQRAMTATTREQTLIVIGEA